MPTISYRASDGATARCELSDGCRRPRLSIFRADDGTWLLRRQDDGGKPTYTQITDADLAAFHAVAERVRPTGPLAPIARKLLKAIKAKGATNERRTASKDAIAKKAGVGHHKTRRVQDAFADLQRRGLIISRQKAGTWLTQAGRAAVAGRRDDANK